MRSGRSRNSFVAGAGSRALVTLATFLIAWLTWLVAPAAAHAAEASFTSGMGASFVPTSVAASLPMTAPAPSPESVPPSSRAPLCDPRGAITFAPPPQMQDVEVTMDTGLTADDCLAEAFSAHSGRAAPGRAPLPIDASSASTQPAVITPAVSLVACGRELLPAPVASTTCSRPGIRSTVDRPPRV
jgi:hypothetical protein